MARLAGKEILTPAPEDVRAEENGGRTRARTWDPLIKSQLLYQLSYASAPVGQSGHLGAEAADCNRRRPGSRRGRGARRGIARGAGIGRPLRLSPPEPGLRWGDG